MRKLAIIGASYLQEPLIRKAKDYGLETHVFAWKCGDIGETIADFFYPISIVEKEAILDKCKEIGIDGICTISSDLAAVAVNYVAQNMGLIGNSMEATLKSTNKYHMRKCFEENGDPSAKCILVSSVNDLQKIDLDYPVIIKPLDRSGSRGITKVQEEKELASALEAAISQGFLKQALVEEFVTGQEYSVECISEKGNHVLLSITKKFTTADSHFIEIGHLEPADVTKEVEEKIKSVVFHALDSLEIKNGASHSELKVAQDGTIKIIEIGGRMGGDFIGSHLVEISTGFDFVKAVIQVALGDAVDYQFKKGKIASIRFVFNQEDLEVLEKVEKDPKVQVIQKEIHPIKNEKVLDSAGRFGYYLMCADSLSDIEPYLPTGVNNEKES